MLIYSCALNETTCSCCCLLCVCALLIAALLRFDDFQIENEFHAINGKSSFARILLYKQAHTVTVCINKTPKRVQANCLYGRCENVYAMHTSGYTLYTMQSSLNDIDLILFYFQPSRKQTQNR